MVEDGVRQFCCRIFTIGVQEILEALEFVQDH